MNIEAYSSQEEYSQHESSPFLDAFYSSFNKQQEFGCGQAWRPGGNCRARRAEDVESAKKLLRLFNQRGCRQCDGNDKNAQTILESKRLE